MERIEGDTGMTSGDGRVESHMHLGAGPARDPADAGLGSEGPRFDSFRGRASDFAGRARERFGNAAQGAGGVLQRSGDVLTVIRENPITSVGVAFSTGFVIAAATGGRNRHWAVDRARRQLRTIVVSALTATIAQELRSLIDEEDLDELRRTYLSHEDEDLDDEESFGEDDYDDIS